MTSKISAMDARELMPNNDSDMEYAYNRIREAALLGESSVKLVSDFWVNEGYSDTMQWKKCVSELKSLGYIVEFVYVERQFVDMYTKVSW